MSFTKLFPHVASGIVAWANENNVACHISCDTNRIEGLPAVVVKKYPDVITLSIGAEASNSSLDVNQESMIFNCRFNGTETRVIAPLESIQFLSVPDAGLIVGNEVYADANQKKLTDEITFSDPVKSKLRIVE